MKTTFVVFLLTTFLSFTAFSQDGSKKVEETTFKVNMHCMSCKNKVEKNMSFEKGVKDLKADLATNTVTITYRSDKTSSEKLKEAIIKLGYKAEIVEAEQKEN